MMLIWFEKYFSVQVFFLIFRETIETAIIVSVLLAFLNQGFGQKSIQTEHEIVESETPIEAAADEDRLAPTEARKVEATSLKIYRQLVFQVWAGAILGLSICLVIGSFFVFAFYYLGKNLWGATEKLWEAIFSILASLIITFMGATMLRVNKMREKWRVKIAQSIIETHKGNASWGLKYLSRRYAIAILPLVTTLREGLEAVVFLGGIGANQPATSFPLPVITAILLGSFIGWVMYRTGDHMSIHYFLIASTCFLYLVAAGLMSRGVWFLELQQFINHVGQDVSEMGSGPGSYDITKSVWHVNCCNSQTDGPWMIFNALLGWQNSATYGSVISYNLYWWAVMIAFYSIKQREKYGYFPLVPKRFQKRYVPKYNYTREEADAMLAEATNLYTYNYNDESTELAANNGPAQSRQSHESLDSNTPLVVRN